MAAINLTAAAIDKLHYDPSGPSRQVLWDAKQRGLGVRVTPAGGRQYVLLYRRHGRSHLMSLGPVSDFRNVTDARDNAAEHLRQLRREDVDPLVARRRGRAAGTCAEMFARWLVYVGCKCAPSTKQDYTALVQRFLNPEIGGHRPADVTRGELRRMHARLTDQRGKVTANRTLQILRAAYNWQLRQDDDTLPAVFANPVKGIEFHREKPRDEYLRPDELPLIAREIEAESDPWARAFLWLAILTGARGGELVKLRWDDVHLDRAELVLRETKNKTDFRMKLAGPAVKVLESLPRAGAFVFPPRRSDGDAPYMAKPRTAWAALLKRAGITRQVTLHDVRRSVGVLLSSRGFSAEQIARQLNHESNITSRVYVRIADQVQQRMADELGRASLAIPALAAPS